MISPSLTEAALMRALGDFIKPLVDCPVVRGQNNRVPLPAGDCIIMTPTGAVPLSTNVDAFSDSTKTVTRPTQFNVQIDCYGAAASDRAQTIGTLLRDDYACQKFADSGVQPLFAGDAHQMPLVTGEQQYVERWTFEACFQYNPVLTVPQDSANALDVDLIDVDAAYPPA